MKENKDLKAPFPPRKPDKCSMCKTPTTDLQTVGMVAGWPVAYCKACMVTDAPPKHTRQMGKRYENG